MIFFKQLIKNRSFTIGSIIILIFTVLAIFPGLFTPYSPIEPLNPNINEVRLLPPSNSYILGTDDLGRDLWTRIIYAIPISLSASLLSVLIALSIGTIIGLISGYFGKLLDEILMRIMDILLAFPSILLAILIVAILGPNIVNAVIAISIVEIPKYSRLVRGVVLSLKTQEFVLAAQAIGANNFQIIVKHILPNSISPIIVQGTLGLGSTILELAALSFLGLGVSPPTPELGAILNGSKDFIRTAPWLIIFPGLTIILIVLGFNLFGDGLRDLLDPHTKKN